jgi:multiple sugar transport system substrate-binding protein
MTQFLRSRSRSPLRTTRRDLLGVIAGAASIGVRASPTRARQSDGSIRVGYDGSNETMVPFIEATAESIRQQRPEARIELEPSPGGGYATQLVLQLTRGNAPDIFLFTGLLVAELATSGVLAPLDPYLDQWDGWEQYPEDIRSAVRYEGSIWAIPNPVDTHFLYYRKDIFAQAGLPEEWQPATPDEILDAAVAIRESAPEIIPYALYAGTKGGNGTVARGFLPLVHAFGGTLLDENGKWIVDSCAIRAALAHYERAYRIDETVPQDVMTGASPSSAMRDAMADGSLGILHEGCWVYGPWAQEDPEQTAAHIGYTQFPSADGNPPFSVGGIGACWYMSAGVEQPDLAWEFITAFNSRENQVAMNVADPHIPARRDAADAPAFQVDPFLQAMIETSSSLVLLEPEPSFRPLIPIIQHITGAIASGEDSPAEALDRYLSEVSRVLGEDQVVSQPCERGEEPDS